MAVLSVDQVEAALKTDPSIYPQAINLARQAVLFLRLERPTLRTASFLDDRILTAQSEGRWVTYAQLARWISGPVATRPLHFIFHAGHVGSTLISRLLDDIDGVLNLREPMTLRVLAEAADDAQAPHALASEAQVDALLLWFNMLWSRGYPDTNAVVLKATSSAGRLAPTLLRINENARAIYLNLKPEPYIATLLAGENSYLDLRGHGPERYKRLSRIVGPPPTPLHAMSLGELAMLTWLVETLSQQEAQRVHGERVLPLDFDNFLAAPAETMRSICAHLQIEASEGFFSRVPESPVLTRYSKAPDHPYSTELRAQLLAQSRQRNAAEIRKGLNWLEAFAQRSPLVQATLSA